MARVEVTKFEAQLQFTIGNLFIYETIRNQWILKVKTLLNKFVGKHTKTTNSFLARFSNNTI